MKTLAGTTGLEPATSCVTGMRSNQLNYVPLTNMKVTHGSRTVAGKGRRLIMAVAVPGPLGCSYNARDERVLLPAVLP